MRGEMDKLLRFINTTECVFQGNSPQARTIAAALSQKLQQLKNKMQDALVNQVGILSSHST